MRLVLSRRSDILGRHNYLVLTVNLFAEAKCLPFLSDPGGDNSQCILVHFN
jgi:hypothetical protein